MGHGASCSTGSARVLGGAHAESCCGISSGRKGARVNIERNAFLAMTYFHPWTLGREHASETVPHVADLAQGRSWSEAFENWLQFGQACKEQRQYLQNFLNVTRIRPGDLVEDDSEEEVEHDADEAPTWQVGEDNLQQALETQAPCHAKL